MKHVIVGVVLLAAAAVASGAAFEFTLEDQNGVRWSSQQLRGKPYVLIVADRDGAEESNVWGEYLGKHVGTKLPILGCANLDGVPFLLRWLARIKARERVTAAPVLLDWDGAIFRAYQCPPGVPTVLVFDASGLVAFRYSGAPTEAARQTVLSRVSSLARLSSQ